MVIELCVVQFWSEIMLVISNRTRAARSFDFEIMRMISDQIALHSVQLPIYFRVYFITRLISRTAFVSKKRKRKVGKEDLERKQGLITESGLICCLL